MRLFLFLLLGLLVIYVVSQILRTQHFIRIGNRLAAEAVPFSRVLPGARMHILVVGDSTGVGTGASSSSTSIAGLVGKKYPEAEIVNLAVNGAKTREVRSQLEKATGNFDLVMVHVGGNDNVRFTPYEELSKDIRSVLDAASSKGKNVLLTTTGNVGTVPLFPAPTRWIFGRRSRQIRTIFLEQVAASKGSVRYTDLFREKTQDPFAIDPKRHYAKDSFHPSDAGYADWFSLISKELDRFPLKRS